MPLLFCRDWTIVSSNHYTASQINTMELELLSLLHFNAYISEAEFGDMLRRVRCSSSSPVEPRF